MSVRAPKLAKLTRPKLYEALERPRLFALLDEAARRPIVWVTAPPGAGKTTLVASYVEARGLRHLWVQIDAGDADPATFAHYLRLAAQPLVRRGGKLPLFAPQPQQQMGHFARSFLRDLFSVLPQPCAIVLDNFHEAPATPENRAAFAQGLEEIPEGITVFVASRADPPPEFARLAASRRIGRIDESALRCTAEEADAILGGQVSDREIVQRILLQSEGWVAALVLLREHQSHRGATPQATLGEGKEAVFPYFAGEIFNRIPPERQRMLMLTAILPSFTQEEAVAVADDADAARLLEYLYRRHLFVDRRRDEHTIYQYHGLFREYLRSEMHKRLPREMRQAALERAAALLAEREPSAEALELYREAGQWDALRQAIGRHALDWARQGRAQMLSDWIEALPSELRADDPWLDYWTGRAWIFQHAQRGRPALERAFERFRTLDDARGQAMALATLVTGCYYEWADFRPLDRWLPEFDRLLPEGEAAGLDRQSELRLRAAQLIVLLFRRPDLAAVQRCAERLDALVDEEPDVTVRVMAASILLNTYNWIKADSADAAQRLVDRIAPLMATAEVAPLMQLWWRTHLSFWHYVAGRYGEADKASAEAHAIGERYGLEAYLFEVDHGQAIALIGEGELTAAKVLVEAIEQRLSSTRRMDWAYFAYLRSLLAQRLGEHASAVQQAERAVVLGRETGLPTLQLPQLLMRLAYSRSAAGDARGCEQAIDEAIALAGPADRANLERQRELLQIADELERGKTTRAAQALPVILGQARATGQRVFMRHRPDLAARLCDFALEQGIETDFVRQLIERNALVAPAGAGAAWPFRLRVRVLGGFELVRDGQTVRFSGKLQQRPLDLLKLVVALGGQDVDSHRVMDALWPDADGAAAKASFDTALFRLRKLLEVEQAVTLAGGRLALSPTLVWTDLQALDATIAAVQDVDASSGPLLAAAAARLCRAYAGPLLGEDDAPWAAKPRELVRARFTRALATLGEALERSAHWPAAIELYRRGLEADNLSESFYRGLMRALAASGDPAEAIGAYRRCRELLAIVLGMAPSPETERLYRQIGAAAGARRPA